MANPYNFRFIKDPIVLVRVLWPHISLYNKEREILYSVWQNDQTVVPACHMGGKDFTAALACLTFFLSRSPCRVITTSVDETQLEGVLWGEIRNLINTCKYPLEAERGGPLLINYMHIRKVATSGENKGQVEGLSYLIGRVAKRGEGMSGHHIAKTGDGIPRTLFVADEASGIDEIAFEKASEWANRQLIIGNPYDCRNEFYYSVEGNPKTGIPGGDIPREGIGEGYVRKIIHIAAEDTPNVQYGMRQKELGIAPTNDIIIPGVLPYFDYLYRLKYWDEIKKCVGVSGRFFKGAQNLMYPPSWLDRANQIADELILQPRLKREAKALGIDPGEGAADTSWAVGDEYGLMDLVSKKTPDTASIVAGTIEIGRKWGIEPENWVFDRGGGGKQHADRLREMGYDGVRTVSFGETIILAPRRGLVLLEERQEVREQRYTYLNRRAEMYGALRILLDPLDEKGSTQGWAIPRRFHELRRQLAPIPLLYDSHGRMYMLPKTRPDPKDKRPTLTSIIGRSPDDADAVVLMIHGMLNKARIVSAGVD